MDPILRTEAREIEDLPSWILIHGRRKVGKTFILRNFIRHDVYVTVRRDGASYATGLPLERIESPERLVYLVGPLLKDGRTVIIDEFQRLPESFLDEIATFHPHGRLILSGSSMRVVKRVMGIGAPLVGLMSVYQLGLLRPTDALRAFQGSGPELAVPLSAYLRDPWLVDMYKGETDLEVFLHKAIRASRMAIPALIGEVFVESERSLTQVYEGVLRGVGAGLWSPGQVAHRLHTTGLLGSDAATHVMPYLKNLEDMGLVTSVDIFGMRRRKVHRLVSQMMDTFYYLADRHQTDEVDRPLEEVRPNLRRMVSQAVERFVGELFQQLEEGRLEYSFDPELDFIITKGRNRTPSTVGEVRWGRYAKSDVEDFARKVGDLDCRKVFVTPRVSSAKVVGEVEVLGATDILRMASTIGGKD